MAPEIKTTARQAWIDFLTSTVAAQQGWEWDPISPHTAAVNNQRKATELAALCRPVPGEYWQAAAARWDQWATFFSLLSKEYQK